MSIYPSSAHKRVGQITAAMLAMLLTLASGARSESLTQSKTISEKQQAAASAYWTRERIAAAPALRLPVDLKPRKVDPAVFEEAENTGPEGSVAPGMADPDASRIARAFFPRDWAALDEDSASASPNLDEATGTAGVFTSYDVNTYVPLWQIYPHVWSGKLTFTTASGGASCSATVLRGNNIVTAAHCVYDTTNNVYYSNWVFTPAYRNGSAPYGTFTARTCSILTAYAGLTGTFNVTKWSRYDVAVCTLNNNSAGQSVNGAVGSAGRTWNAGNNQLVFINGYPARDYTNATIANGPAQYLRSCTSETLLFTTETLEGGCNWSSGISGGSWLIGYKPFVISGQVDSVTSGIVVGQTNLYGARFNSNNIVPLCTARGC
jgi:V8-like Glu-specific endopeptidase